MRLPSYVGVISGLIGVVVYLLIVTLYTGAFSPQFLMEASVIGGITFAISFVTRRSMGRR